ncbi:MAG: hypothetical protein KDD32_07055 [Bacteroidetes bacterium]|nr:hypothetical protein [Bacteroidota bacterium]
MYLIQLWFFIVVSFTGINKPNQGSQQGYEKPLVDQQTETIDIVDIDRHANEQYYWKK